MSDELANEADQDLAQYNGYRVRGRYIKWYIYLYKDGVDVKKEIGPFDYSEINSYVASHCQHMKDLDKG